MDNFTRKRLVKSKSGLKIVSSDEMVRSPFELREPEWVPDEKSPDCTQCHTKFDFLRRRHHCRRCGQVYCGTCCVQKVPVRRMCFVDPVRLCSACIAVTQRENDFYERHLKVLATGANFQMHATVGQEENALPFFCRLSPDHREIMFDGGSSLRHDPLPLGDISSVKLLRSSELAGENEVGSAQIAYVAENEPRTLCLSVASVPNHKLSALWIISLRKAMKLLKDRDDWSSSFQSSLHP